MKNYKSKAYSIKFILDKNLEKRIYLRDVKEKSISIVNTNEIDLSDFLGRCV